MHDLLTLSGVAVSRSQTGRVLSVGVTDRVASPIIALEGHTV